MSATRRRAGRSRVLVAAVPVVLVAVLSAACGGLPTPRAEAKPTLSGTDTLVGTNVTKYGTVLSDGLGRTLYAFAADQPGQSTCYGECTQVWTPYIATGHPAPADRTLNAILEDSLQTITRKDGDVQVSYNGHSLYRYSRDEDPGDARGQDVEQFGGAWYVLSPSGEPVKE